jgi:cytochrome c oxidase subunit 1
LIAGLTGIMLSVAPWNWQLHNSYFVIAHFHYVLVGAIRLLHFCGDLLLVSQITGRMLSETLGKWHFWLFLIGFHVTFDTMHFVGFSGCRARSIRMSRIGDGITLNLIISRGG